MHIGINSIAESRNRGCDSLIPSKRHPPVRHLLPHTLTDSRNPPHPICAIRLRNPRNPRFRQNRPRREAQVPAAGRGTRSDSRGVRAAVRHPAHPRSTYLYPNSFPIPKIPSIPKFPVLPKSLDSYRAVVLALEMYTHLVSDRRIRATIKSRLGERKQEQYVDGNQRTLSKSTKPSLTASGDTTSRRH